MEMECPKCKSECDRVSVHNGVGMVYSPWGCYNCGWSESPEYDLSEGRSHLTKDGIIDQFGMLLPLHNDN